MSIASTSITLQRDIVIVGLPLRTRPAEAAVDIPAHWQRFMREEVGSTIAAKQDDGYLYAVYCDYESDFRGAYTMVLGMAVDPAAPVPPGLRRVRIPAGRSASFATKGAPGEVVWKTWNHVNTEWPEREQGRYIADFERYVQRSISVDSIEADVVVGLA